jgi:hypothetical protein
MRAGKYPYEQRNTEDAAQRNGVGQVHTLGGSGGQPATKLIILYAAGERNARETLASFASSFLWTTAQ